MKITMRARARNTYILSVFLNVSSRPCQFVNDGTVYHLAVVHCCFNAFVAEQLLHRRHADSLRKQHGSIRMARRMERKVLTQSCVLGYCQQLLIYGRVTGQAE